METPVYSVRNAVPKLGWNRVSKNKMSNLFFLFLKQPLANLLILFGNVAGGEMGLAIILLTLFIRILLLPLTVRIVRDQEMMQRLEPELAVFRKKFAGDRIRLGQEMTHLFKAKGVSPFRPVLLTLLQLPILIALWRLFSFSFSQDSLDQIAYPFVHLQANASFNLLGLLPLAERNIILAILAGILQWFAQPKTGLGKKQAAAYIFPLFSIFIFSSLPAAISLYWASSSFFGMLEQRLIIWKHLRRKESSSPSLQS